MSYEGLTSVPQGDPTLEFSRLPLPSVSYSDDSLTPVLSNQHGYDHGLGDNSLPCECLPEPPEFDLRPPPKFLKFFMENSNSMNIDASDENFSCGSENNFVPYDSWPAGGFVDGTVTDGFGGTVTATDESSIYYGLVTLSVAAVLAIAFTLCFLCCQRFRLCCRCYKYANSKACSKSTVTVELDQNSLAYSAHLTRKFDWSGEEIPASFSTEKSVKKNGLNPSFPGFVVIRPVEGLSIERRHCQPAGFAGTISSTCQNDNIAANSGTERPLPNPPPYGTFKPSQRVIYGFGPNSSRSLPFQDHHNLTYEEISLDRFVVDCPAMAAGRLLALGQYRACDPYAETGNLAPKKHECVEMSDFQENSHKLPSNGHSVACGHFYGVMESPKNINFAHSGPEYYRTIAGGHFCRQIPEKSDKFCRLKFARPFCGRSTPCGQHPPGKMTDRPAEPTDSENNPAFSADSACCSCCGGSISLPGSGSGSRSASVSDQPCPEPCRHNVSHDEPSPTCKNVDQHVYDRIGQEYEPIGAKTKIPSTNQINSHARPFLISSNKTNAPDMNYV